MIETAWELSVSLKQGDFPTEEVIIHFELRVLINFGLSPWYSWFPFFQSFLTFPKSSATSKPGSSATTSPSGSARRVSSRCGSYNTSLDPPCCCHSHSISTTAAVSTARGLQGIVAAPASGGGLNIPSGTGGRGGCWFLLSCVIEKGLYTSKISFSWMQHQATGLHWSLHPVWISSTW